MLISARIEHFLKFTLCSDVQFLRNEILKDALVFSSWTGKSKQTRGIQLHLGKRKGKRAAVIVCATSLKVSETGFYKWKRNRTKMKRRHLLLVEIHKILSYAPENET